MNARCKSFTNIHGEFLAPRTFRVLFRLHSIFHLKSLFHSIEIHTLSIYINRITLINIYSNIYLIRMFKIYLIQLGSNFKRHLSSLKIGWLENISNATQEHENGEINKFRLVALVILTFLWCSEWWIKNRKNERNSSLCRAKEYK